MKKLVCFVIVSLFCLTVGAVETCPNNEIWYTSSNGKVAKPYKTGVFGATIVSNTYSGGKGIIKFNGNVTSIGYRAFSGCSGLTSVDIPNSVTSIGEFAFENCSCLTSITIPNFVTSIGEYAFIDCSSLTSITIPNSVTSIGYGAFHNCSGLTSVDIPNSVTSIGNYAFYKCSGLTSINIPNSITSIGFRTFSYCSGLTSITIPNSVTSIDNSAFEYCSGLTSINIPNSVISIGDFAFEYCSGLTSIIIPNFVTSIGNGAFEYCSGLTSVTIGNSVKSIGGYAFSGCSNMTDLYFNADSLSNYCFPSSLTKVIIGKNVKIIPSNFISGNSKITNIDIPNSVTSIGYRAFSGCSGIKKPTYNNKFFVKLPVNYSGEYKIQEGIQQICDKACYGCSSLTNVTFPNSVTTICDSAFYNSGLTSINLPSTIKKLGSYTFYNCYNCTELNYDVEDCTNYYSGGYSFASCAFPSTLTKVVVGKNVKKIPIQFLMNCTNLTKVIILSNPTVDKYAFKNCDRISRIECYSTEPPTISNSSDLFTSGVFAHAILHVPTNYKLDYSSTYGWRDFIYIIDDLEGYTPEPKPSTLKCDANGDGVVDVSDITTVATYILTNSKKDVEETEDIEE